MLPHITAQLAAADRVDIVVAFALESGVDRVFEHFRDLLAKGGCLRLLTGDYLGITEPNALMRLLDLEGRVELRIFETGTVQVPMTPTVRSFHPKAYIFREKDAGTAFVGSSNLSASALTSAVEWNYRVVSKDGGGFDETVAAFEELFAHPSAKLLDAEWIDRYRERRPIQRPIVEASEVPLESPKPPVQPNEIQIGRASRPRDNADRRQSGRAGGSGDRPRQNVALGIRHESSRVSPDTLRRAPGGDSQPGARHVPSYPSGGATGALHRRDEGPRRRGGVCVDPNTQPPRTPGPLRARARSTTSWSTSFTTRPPPLTATLIAHFRPKFMLGLTATPERSDGGDLLALCQQNLVYRCDLVEGVRRDLLSPFHYFGVPDEVDYTNIPWRSTRFDEEALTDAVATQCRAQNALEQFRKRAARRALGFCVSQRHADFMAAFFAERGIRAVAVHSGETSAPRAAALEQLSAGELDIVFAVDMFNEGVDLPNLDTVMMLRPTESKILWLQQFGRGLRKAEGKERLTVIDYIGNHRVFLLKPQTLFGLSSGDREILNLLERLRDGSQELPPGCEVTYELGAIDILRGLLRVTTDQTLALDRYYQDFKALHGIRPTALEVYQDGYNPRAVRAQSGSWARFVGAHGDLDDSQRQALENHGAFIDALDTTDMTKSYKMLVLLAMLNGEAFPGSMGIEALADEVNRLATRTTRAGADLGSALTDRKALIRLLEENPIAAWTGGKGTGGVSHFAYRDRVFRTTIDVSPAAVQGIQELVREIAEWRLAQYLDRAEVQTVGYTTLKVSHAGGKPILFLPSGPERGDLPNGWTDVQINDEEYSANFVKVAINVVRRPGSEENELARIIRGWFGADAGAPGTRHSVALEQLATGWTMRPIGQRAG